MAGVETGGTVQPTGEVSMTRVPTGELRAEQRRARARIEPGKSWLTARLEDGVLTVKVFATAITPGGQSVTDEVIVDTERTEAAQALLDGILDAYGPEAEDRAYAGAAAKLVADRLRGEG